MEEKIYQAVILFIKSYKMVNGIMVVKILKFLFYISYFFQIQFGEEEGELQRDLINFFLIVQVREVRIKIYIQGDLYFQYVVFKISNSDKL